MDKVSIESLGVRKGDKIEIEVTGFCMGWGGGTDINKGRNTMMIDLDKTSEHLRELLFDFALAFHRKGFKETDTISDVDKFINEWVEKRFGNG